MNIYYFHPLALTFTSAQTVQVVRAYRSLASLGHRVFLYGTFTDKESLAEVQAQLEGTNVHLSSRRDSRGSRLLLKLAFLRQAIRDPGPKVMVTRNIDKALEIARYRPLLRRVRSVTEMHQEAFPYLFKASKTKQQFARAMAETDLILFTGPAQTLLYRQEFGALPGRYVVLPNGAEVERYRGISPGSDGVLTYVGQLSPWKNVELLFESLALLDQPLRLRIAGGKNDSESARHVDKLAVRHGVRGRVDFLGYIPPDEVASRALQGSSALLLPLGDNLQSRYLTSPVKLFEYMATGIPVVAVDLPSVTELAGPQALYLAAPEAHAFAAAIRRAITDPDREHKITAMNALAEHYGHVRRAQRYEDALAALWRDAPPPGHP